MNGNEWIEKRSLLQEIALAHIDYETRQKVNQVIDGAKTVNLLDRDKGKEPHLKSKSMIYHESRADGTGGFKRHDFEDWVCPTCGWFVGELYSGYGKWHIQGETSYCAKCGQKIDWTKPSEEEKRRYEETRAKEREEWEKKNGSRLDNMNEWQRKKYGMLAGKESER